MKRIRFNRRNASGWILFSALFVLSVSAVMLTPYAGAAEKKAKKSDKQKLLERYAARSLFRLKLSIKKDGFYNCRVSLNVWKSNAIEAGIYDQALYDDFKKQIYTKSIQENKKWFEIFIKQKSYSDARTCLRLWRLHSEEIGVLDEEKYNEMKEQLK